MHYWDYETGGGGGRRERQQNNSRKRTETDPILMIEGHGQRHARGTDLYPGA